MENSVMTSMNKKKSLNQLLVAAGQRVKEREYWQTKLAGFLERTRIPADIYKSTTGHISKTFEEETFEFSQAEASGLLKLSRGSDVRLHVLQLAVMNAVLYHYQAMTVSGTPDAGGRNFPETGDFGHREGVDIQLGIPVIRDQDESDTEYINTFLIQRNRLTAGMTLKELILAVRQTMVEAVEHRNYPVEILAGQMGMPYERGEDFPLCDLALYMDGLHERGHLNHIELNMRFALARKGNSLSGRIEYNSLLYQKTTAQQVITRIKQVVAAMIDSIDIEVGRVEMMTPEEKKRIEQEFNATDRTYPTVKTIHGQFLEQVRRNPRAVALIGEQTLTYSQLNRRARYLSARLRERGAAPGVIVALQVERSVEMMTGILAILKAGAAYMPIEPEYPRERIEFMLKDSNAGIILKESESNSDDPNSNVQNRGNIPEELSFEQLGFEADSNFETDGSDIENEESTTSSPAYVIYTSGSTGKPKGVLVEHQAVVNLLNDLQERYPVMENDTYLMKTAFIFDVSVTELFGWYGGGGRLAILKTGREKDPRRLLDTVEEYGITHINFVPAMFSAFIDAIDEENKEKLSRLKYIFVAGEKLHPEQVNRFLEKKTGIRLENLYGPTEATVYASGYSLSNWDGWSDIPIGRPLGNMRLSIIDSRGKPQPIGIPGELSITGAGLARGYLNRPQLTAERFTVVESTEPGARRTALYRTGDLARWLPDGNIQFLGRLDHQVKIRGYRIELGEIENRILKNPKIRETRVITGGGNPSEGRADDMLWAYIVTGDGDYIDTAKIRQELEQQLPGYMVPAHIIRLDEMPLGPGGKVDTAALPPPVMPEAAAAYAAPRDEREKTLAEMWRQILGVNSTESRPSAVGIDDNFFQLGGHSLTATTLVYRIYKEFGRNIEIDDIFDNPTIRQLAPKVGTVESRDLPTGIEPVEDKEYYPLSSPQMRQYVLQQMDRDSTGYNITTAVILEGPLDVERLENVLRVVIDAHESLRTSFVIVENRPVQRIHREVFFKIQRILAGDGTEAETVNRFVRPFDLERAPLVRVGIIENSEIIPNRYTLMVDMHHIISDGQSLELFIRELIARYRGETPEPVKIRYRDVSRWQNHRLKEPGLRKQEDYWLRELSEEVPEMLLPTDRPRQSEQSPDGDRMPFEIDENETSALKRLAKEEGATLFMMLQAIFTIYLSKVAGAEDIRLGTPVAGRNHADMKNIMGMFVNTLVIRNMPEGRLKFRQYLQTVKRKTLAALENQEYPYEELVDKLGVNSNTAGNPLFDVMFTMQNWDTLDIRRQLQEGAETANPETDTAITVKPYHREITTSKFDMILSAVEDGPRLKLGLTYRTKLFNRNTIQRQVQFLKRIVTAVIREPDQLLSGIELLTPEEKRQIRRDAEGARQDFPEDKTLHRVFEEHAKRTPDAIAVVGPPLGMQPGGKEIETTLTYERLNRQAEELAQQLRKKGVGTGTVVALRVHRSVEMIIGILAILKSGAAYMPVSPEIPVERLIYMLRDSGSTMLLADESFNVADLKESESQIDVLNIETAVSGESQTANQETVSSVSVTGSAAAPDGRCYIIYTSGSTGKPKGVQVSHRSAVNVVTWFARNYRITNGSRVLQMSEYTFDPSVEQIFGTLLHGATLYVVDKQRFVNIPELRRYISLKGIQLLNHVPWMLNELLGRGPRLRCLRTVISGGERLVESVKNNILEKGYQLYNHYGPTEITVDALVEKCTDAPVTLGTPIANVSVWVQDRNRNLVPEGVAGELVISGTGVADGYINRPELTDACFGEEIIRDYPDEPGKKIRFYRTGDQVRRLPNGKIEFLGRMDQQVKIRGFRIELGEIENRLLMHPAVNQTAVVHRESENGDNMIAAYIELKDRGEHPTAGEIKEFLARKLPEYMIPANIEIMDWLPKTMSGKIDRKALPKPSSAPTKDITPPQTPTEKKIHRIWQEVLVLDNDTIGIDTGFFEIGGHSIKAMQLVSGIHRQMDVNLPLMEIFKRPTIRRQAEYIDTAEREKYSPITTAPVLDDYRLSPAQKRLYILYEIVPNEIVYNMPTFLEIEGELDMERLQKTFQQLIQRHESFRTSFPMVYGEPRQKIHPSVDFQVEQIEPGLEDIDTATYNYIRPFDLSRAPLIRVGLIEETKNRHRLIVDMHHIISDGESVKILVREFQALMAGNTLPQKGLQYKDYSQWLHREENQQRYQKQKDFWMKQFDGEIPVLDIPIDSVRPQVQQFEGDQYNFTLSTRQTRKLKELATSVEATLFQVLLAALSIQLSKMSGNEDIIVGTPVTGRYHADQQDIIGMFVNTLALRSAPIGEKTFNDYLTEVKNSTLEAFENQDYPFEELVENLKIKRDPGRNPLMDVVFSYGKVEQEGLRLPGLKIKALQGRNTTTKFDLTLHAVDTEERLQMIFEYATALYNPETIERTAAYLIKVLTTVTGDIETPIGKIEIISDEEKSRILNIFNGNAEQYPTAKTLHGLFEEQVRRTPLETAVAAVGKDEKNSEIVSYERLEKQSNQLAWYLRSLGVSPGSPVAVMMKRGPRLLQSILAIMKAGCVYVPVDENAPAGRIETIFKECRIRGLLTTGNMVEHFGKHHSQDPGIELVNVDDEYEYKGQPVTSLELVVEPDQRAYIIFTSGSTGRPKGVPITHANVSPLLHWGYRQYGIGTGDRALQNLSYYFDWSVWEIFITVTTGAALYVAPDEIMTDPGQCIPYMKEQRITVLHGTPSQIRYFVDAGQPMETLKYLFIGAEKLSRELCETSFKAVNNQCRVFNMYGPTEATIIAATYEMERGDHQKYRHLTSIPIGISSGNTTLYILDRYSNLCPVNVTGDLYIGGDGLSDGYINNPELTARRFVEKNISNINSKDGIEENQGRKKGTGNINGNINEKNELLYKTGDRARWLEDGNIEFLGRDDHQVKLRGYRIELGEIENRIKEHHTVRDAVVQVVGKNSSSALLCAYVVLSGRNAETSESDTTWTTNLKEHLAHYLPEYMVPTHIIPLEKIPLTPNRKLDTKALPLPDRMSSSLQNKYAPPNTEMQKIISEIWEQELNLEKVGIRDNFFDLGGNSLVVIKVNRRLKERLQRDIDTTTIFLHPTIAQLSQALSGNGEKQQPEEKESSERGEVVSEGRSRLQQRLKRMKRS
jgi:tyrocidine synthetase III